MLPAKHRLKIKSGKSLVWKDKKEAYTPLFKVIYRLRAGDELPKVGFIVSGKVGTAVTRNRVRRLLSEGVRNRIRKFPNGSEILIIANKETGEVSYEEICNSLDKFLSKSGFASG
jgi:ribonuclease P protein component